jgi:hypothetical protein
MSGIRGFRIRSADRRKSRERPPTLHFPKISRIKEETFGRSLVRGQETTALNIFTGRDTGVGRLSCDFACWDVRPYDVEFYFGL